MIARTPTVALYPTLAWPRSSPIHKLCLLCFFSSRRRHTRLQGDWSSDVCSSDLFVRDQIEVNFKSAGAVWDGRGRSEEHTSELQSPCNLVCRLLLEKTNTQKKHTINSGRAEANSPVSHVRARL